MSIAADAMQIFMVKGIRFFIFSHPVNESPARKSRLVDHSDPNMGNPTLVLPAVNDANTKCITAPPNKKFNFENIQEHSRFFSDREK